MNTSAGRSLYCSTGTMIGRINGFRWQLILEQMPALVETLPLDGVELMMLPAYYEQMDEMERSFRDAGLHFPVIHCEKEIGTMLSRNQGSDTANALDLFKRNCEMGQRVGASRMVFHLWGGRDSDTHIEYNISMLDTLLAIIKPYCMKLLIENVPCTTCSPLDHWRRLYSCVPEIGFVFDTRFGELHRQSPAILAEEFLWKKSCACCYRKIDGDVPCHDAPISHIHISDFNGGCKDFAALRPILHPGEGHIDFPMIARALDANAYTGSITLESPVITDTGLDIPKLEQSLRYIRRLMVEHSL